MPNLDKAYAIARENPSELFLTLNFKPIVPGSSFEKKLLNFPLKTLREKYVQELDDWSSPETMKHESLEKPKFDIPRYQPKRLDFSPKKILKTTGVVQESKNRVSFSGRQNEFIFQMHHNTDV